MSAIDSIHNKKILYSCLDWGMGHVSRSIGIIRQLISQNNEVFFVGNNLQNSIVENYFPEIKFFELNANTFQFSGKGWWTFDLLKSTFSFLKNWQLHQSIIKKIIQNDRIDLIISDHKYCFFDKYVTNVFVTHQLNLPIKKWAFLGQRLHSNFMSNFDEIWVLDDLESKFSGKLSVNSNFEKKVEYIGLYSRFEPSKITFPPKYEFAFIVNGPKEYSQKMYDEVIRFYRDNATRKSILISTYEIDRITALDELEIVVSSDWCYIDTLIAESETIVSRCGYSTIMDLEILQKKAILFPTKNQAEQLYLMSIHINHERIQFLNSLSDF